ncbi:MAG: tyrosine-type recombinase/integrase [FCB group bacterium]|nr:tyrosine-type recombinase/integrase [FCB group bacterium]
MDDFAERFHQRGYSRTSACSILRGAAHFSRYAMWLGKICAEDLTPEIADRFLREHLPECSCERPNAGLYVSTASAVDHVLKYLTEKSILTVSDVTLPEDAASVILMKYKKYLIEFRGVASSTWDQHLRQTSRFLTYLQRKHGSLELPKLTSADVLDFLDKMLDYRWSLDWRSIITYCVRTFLRFLRWERIIEQDLSRVVPPVTRWSLENIPRHIPARDVQKLVAAPDISTAGGKRDKVILMLLGLLGLRASEVLALELDHIDWQNRSIIVPATKSSKERALPLMPELAEALAGYIKNGRPDSKEHRKIFFRVRAPIVPLTSGGALVFLVRKYIRKTGIESPSQGTHLLRHSLATKLVNSGVPLKSIADILGHTNINSTKIYSKVDVRSLSDVALPFPMIGGDES